MAQLSSKADIVSFVQEQGYTTQDKDPLLILQDEDGLTIFAVIDDSQVEFMVDLCGVGDLDEGNLEEIYERILDQNTEILPCCFGIDSDDSNDKRIVLVDSLATENLDDNELLLALDSLAVNVITAHDLLSPHIK
ncbi:MAG: CesT family type III secretion system chaperone [Candidatus Poribacteria bacterium]|nr:CesT family type III secretion system chaperone [Candidatus Poribacteria bacterium]MDE0504479.1 CesT family type III secretion system chaperone [Candidatus Poribacteria bacterium]